MKIRGLFCGTTAASNEEYRKALKRRNLWMAALTVAGILIAVAALLADENGSALLPEYVLGVYCGFGTGLALAGILLMIRNVVLMRNEEKLKQSRLENSDERLQTIGNRAALTALKVLLLVIVAGGLIAGIYEQVLIKAVLFLLDVFFLSYIAAFSYFKRRM